MNKIGFILLAWIPIGTTVADEHGGALPDSLDDLAPGYLKELSPDPLAGSGASFDKDTVGLHTPSLQGAGYLYRKGAPGSRAWVIASVGLPGFPYLAAKENAGLYISKRTWISGMNPMFKR